MLYLQLSLKIMMYVVPLFHSILIFLKLNLVKSRQMEFEKGIRNIFLLVIWNST